MEKIDPRNLVPMDLFESEGVLRVDLAYERADNLLFEERIYRPGARLWLEERLAQIVLKAAFWLQKDDLRLVLFDGLRTTEAQAKMLETRRVRDNPQWLEEPRLLSPPGTGGHPRGMAVDCALETLDGESLDMGTAFDHLAEKPDAKHNSAHREYAALTPEARANRDLLTGALARAAEELKIPLLPLPQEWWDFRLLPEIYNSYAPLSDADLPPQMRMADLSASAGPPDFPPEHFETLKKKFLTEITL